MKILDLGCGKHKIKGSVGVDIRLDSQADVIWDLNKFPYKFAKDNSFDLINMNHVLEHLSDTKKVLEEIWRIGKPNAKVIIKTPHFSSCVAYGSIEHCRYFSARAFKLRIFEGKFTIEKIRLNWGKFGSMGAYRNPIKEAFRKSINFFANLNISFCERIWCHWVGGFNEIYVELRVVQ